MNQPLRLAQGQMLFSDVRHIYGPLSPYLNAILYRVFGASLRVLYADGILSAIIILLLVYWIARQLMESAAAAAATLSVMWLCAFKQAGNYILPYSYSALHGCALGMVGLALLVKALGDRAASPNPRVEGGTGAQAKGPASRSAVNPYIIMAGLAAGLTLLAKTEMGLACLLTGLATVWLLGYPRARQTAALAAQFVMPAAVLAGGVYGYIATRVGIRTLSHDSFLFLSDLPPELVYFNKRISGLDQPLQSGIQILGSGLKIAALAVIVAAISLLLTRDKDELAKTESGFQQRPIRDAGRVTQLTLWTLLLASISLFVVVPLAPAIQWDQGPYLAMPALLVVLLVLALLGYQRQISRQGEASKQVLVLITLTIYALASLARVILRVRSGGAYSSYLLPAAVILFVYGWVYPFPDLLRRPRARRLARNIALGLLLADSLGTAALLTVRYRIKNTYPLVSSRGTIVTVPDMGLAFSEAISLIEKTTKPGEPVAVLPEGTSLNFFTGRPNPLREEITTPGFLDVYGEERAIRQLNESNTRLILIANRPTSEFGATAFGRDYCERLMTWIDQNFEERAVLGPDPDPNLRIGDKTFFIRAYMKKDPDRRGTNLLANK